MASEAYLPCSRIFLPAQFVDMLDRAHVLRTFAGRPTLSGPHIVVRSRNSHQSRDMSFLGEIFVPLYSTQHYPYTGKAADARPSMNHQIEVGRLLIPRSLLILTE